LLAIASDTKEDIPALVADSPVTQPVIVSDTHRGKRERSAASDIASDTNMPASHQQMSDSTSGIAVNTSDMNAAAQEECWVTDCQNAFVSWGIVYHRENLSAIRLVAHPCPYLRKTEMH